MRPRPDENSAPHLENASAVRGGSYTCSPDGKGAGSSTLVQRVRDDVRTVARTLPRLRRVRDDGGGGGTPARAPGLVSADAPAPGRRRGRGDRQDPDRGRRARPGARRRSRSRVARPGGRRTGCRQIHAAPLGPPVDEPRAAGAARHRRGVGSAGRAAGRAARRRRGGRDFGRDRARGRLRDARARAAGRLRDRLGADALLRRDRLRPGLGRAGPGGGGAADAGGEGRGVATFLVGHVTKDGSVAGPRVLEHLVDCVLQFEGDRYHAHRVLRATKNRFGSTNELAVFEMTGTGLVGVPDPSALFGRSAPGEVGAAVTCVLEGTRPLLIEIQALVAPTDLAMPRRVATGVDPKRLAMIVAVLGRHAGLPLGSGGRVRERRRRPAHRRAGGGPRHRTRDRLGGARRASRRRRGGIRRDRPHRAPSAGDAGAPPAGRVRQARGGRGGCSFRHRGGLSC